MFSNLLGKCTGLSPISPRLIKVARLGLMALVLMIVTLGGSVPARADIELGHEGQTGRHRLADLYESPGAICDIVLPGRGSLGETRLRINPPVMFARDRTPGLDEQMVGWRVTISARSDESRAWSVVRRSATAKALANDDLATYFDGQSWVAMFPLGRATYSATVEMFWYDPASAERVEGKATHAVEHYSVVLRQGEHVTYDRTSSVCGVPW